MYPLTKTITRSRGAALLSMFFLAISGGSIARTAATLYRGDVFAPLFLIVALLLLCRGVSEGNTGRRIALLVAAPAALAISYALWVGSPFAVAVYALALLAMTALALIERDKGLSCSATMASLSFISFLFVDRVLVYLDLARYTTPFSGLDFFLLWIVVYAVSLVSMNLVRRKSIMSRLESRMARVAIVVGACALGAALLALLFWNYVSFSINLITIPTLVGQTTNELQPPSFSFLMSSFSFQLFFAIAGAVILLLALRKRQKAAMLAGASIIVSYLLVTARLQAGAIRYSSLLSVPIAVLSGYAIVAGADWARKRRITVSRGTRTSALNIYYGFVIALIIICVASALIQYLTEAPGDGINRQFLNAAAWMKSNTPANATVLTLWPDGSVVEGWGNRTSYTDSVGGEENGRIGGFSRFLAGSQLNASYLYRIGKPQYLLVRYFWLSEAQPIAYEGGISNTIPYRYVALPYQSYSNGTYLYSSQDLRYNYSLSVSYIANQLILRSTGFTPSQIIYLNTSTGLLSGTSTVSSGGDSSLLLYRDRYLTGAAVLGGSLANSTMFYLLFQCQTSCSHGNVTLDRIFFNNDTIIYGLLYR
jgi:hypothetical protein